MIGVIDSQGADMRLAGYIKFHAVAIHLQVQACINSVQVQIANAITSPRKTSLQSLLLIEGSAYADIAIKLATRLVKAMTCQPNRAPASAWRIHQCQRQALAPCSVLFAAPK